jgi:bifunctional UDP-N-acetylglucosamine pyrophosphorylase/glucosamine-1-phosphate N-acetyltransferase
MVDPERTYIDSTVRLASDVTIFPGTLLQGATIIGEGVELGPDTRLMDCTVGDRAIVERTVGRHSDIGAGAVVGPYAVLEPGAHIAPGARTGSFYTATAEDAGT